MGGWNGEEKCKLSKRGRKWCIGKRDFEEEEKKELMGKEGKSWE